MTTAEVAVVGAGPAGVAMAVSLCDLGLHPLLIDRADVAASWRGLGLPQPASLIGYFGRQSRRVAERIAEGGAPIAVRSEPTAPREVQSSAVRAYPPRPSPCRDTTCAGVDQVVTDRRWRRKRQLAWALCDTASRQ